MHTQNGRGERAPHILIVSDNTVIHNRLLGIFRERRISHESLDTMHKALTRLEEGPEPSPTGILTEGLEGEWRQAIPAAHRIGAAVVLLTNSSLTRATAISEGIAAYLTRDFDREVVGRAESTLVINRLVADLSSAQ